MIVETHTHVIARDETRYPLQPSGVGSSWYRDAPCTAEELAELEEEALAETGNVILNNCLGTMANMLQRSLTMSLPEVLRGSGTLLFASADGIDEGGLVLFLYINFSVSDHNIRGYIAMLMDLPSMAVLKVLIADFIARVTEGVD